MSIGCGDGCDRDRLVDAYSTPCGLPCYGGNKGQAGVGVCRLGRWMCPDGGGELECVDWGKPRFQECNGLDNNCDGKIDEPARTCSNNCGQGIQVCRTGEWTVCNAPTPRPETCDGKDEDCDGQIDEVEEVAVSFCYSLGLGDESLRHGECRPGITRCVAGEQVCYGEQTPKPETCDGKDQDCDGQVDEDFAEKIDIVFIVDYSCSMTYRIDRVAGAISDWSTSFGTPGHRFALAAAPPENAAGNGSVRLLHNFSDAATLVAKIRPTIPLETFSEPTYDAVADVADYSLNPLGLAWRTDSRRLLFVFTDEDGQSYNYTPPLTELSVAARVAAARPVLRTNFFSSVAFASDYDEIARLGTGKVFDIDMPGPDIQKALNEAVRSTVCGSS